MRRILIYLVKAISRVLGLTKSKFRVLFYNIRVFFYYSPLPFSTTVYGRILFLEAPCRLSLGKRCRLGDGVYFATSLDSEIVVGDDVNINIGCVLVSIRKIEIGTRTSIAEYVSIRDQEHRFAVGKGTRDQGYISAPVFIGENVWIGRGSYIGPGTVIQENSIVAANSVVRGVYPPGVLIAGSPAKVKKVIT